MGFGAPIPILRSFDERRTKAFYLDFLGFELGFEHRFAADMPLYMEVRRGGCALHLSEHYGDGAPGMAVRIAADDVFAYAAELQSRAFENARPGAQVTQDWGMAELSVHDPSHNRLVFYTPVPAAEA